MVSRQNKVKRRCWWEAEEGVAELREGSRRGEASKTFTFTFLVIVTLESFYVFSFCLCLIMIRERSKHVAKLNTLGCPLSKADRGPTKVLCFLQSPTSSVEDLLPASWLETKNNDVGIYPHCNDDGGNLSVTKSHHWWWWLWFIYHHEIKI